VVIIFTLFSAITKDAIYCFGLLLAYLIGAAAILLSIFLSKLQLQDLQNADEAPMGLYKEFMQSYPSLKFGVWRNLLNTRFFQASQATSKIWVRLVKTSLLPGVLIEAGTLISMLVVALIYWTKGIDKLGELFPLYFQITAITVLFLQISVQIPTLKAFQNYISQSKGYSLRRSHSLVMSKTDEELAVSLIDENNVLKFLFGKCYLINGLNGSGKTTLLTDLSRLISSEISLISLNSRTIISFMGNDHIYTDFSDGQRQLFNLEQAISYAPKVLILDEALSGLDKFALNKASGLIDSYCLSGGLVLMVEHGYLPSNFIDLKIDDIIKFRPLNDRVV
jgi:hypothetical protein